MKIAVDLQALQRRWHDQQAIAPLLAAVREMLAGSDGHEFVLLVNGAMQDSAFAIRNEFRKLLGLSAIHAWRAPAMRDTQRASRIGELIREASIAAVGADAVIEPTEDWRAAIKVLAAQAPRANRAASAARPKLAYVSPLAPQRTGIADYSGELLPELARYYDIEVVTDQPEVTDAWVLQNCAIRSAEWFREHGKEYERVLYHLGNSSYHAFMFGLLAQHPGVVVLHDFFLGHILRDMQSRDPEGRAWNRALYDSHGYGALQDALSEAGREEAAWKYPCNLPVAANARGVIVHSPFLQRLASEWWGADLAQRCTLVPLLRVPAPDDAQQERTRAREALGLNEDDFLVCSFGVVGPLKLSDRLFEAWMQSSLARDPRCTLLFVGANDAGEYGQALVSRIDAASGARVRITGWLSAEDYRRFLAAADIAVQLRARSRGETSAAVLDCMNRGVPTIVNAHGAMADLPRDTVHAIADEFTVQELVDALESLHADASRRQALGVRARRHVAEQHAPADCARQYADAIERFHADAGARAADVEGTIAALGPVLPENAQEIARAVHYSLPRPSHAKLLMVDVSAISRVDWKSGIQRVVRSVLKTLLEHPPPGYRIEPVYLSDEGGHWHARYARRYMLKLLDSPVDALDDERVEPDAGDLFLGIDLSGGFVVAAAREHLFDRWRAKGVGVSFVVHDLLPLQMPDKFPPQEIAPFRAWANVVARSDAVLGVSATVAGHFRQWRAKNVHEEPAPFVSHFHHGADIEQSMPTRGMPDDHIDIVSALESRRSFLMVGTIEPRKGQAQALAALELLWAQGVEWNLVLIGRQGWMTEALVKRIREHPQFGRRLFWLQGISDEFLQRIYGLASCLLFPSEGEGFGLPLIEAAQHGLPIVARELPVFREVAGEHAFYFTGLSPRALAGALEHWLQLYRYGLHPRSGGLKWLTWRESTQMILRALEQAGLMQLR